MGAATHDTISSTDDHCDRSKLLSCHAIHRAAVHASCLNNKLAQPKVWALI
jgi:hypothetical protein